MVAPPTPKRISLGDAVDQYLRSVDNQVIVGALSERTAKNYRNDLANFTGIIGADTIVDDITGEQVDHAIVTFGGRPDARYSTGVKTGPAHAASTQRRFRESINRFFTHAAGQAWVQVSPMAWSTLNPRARGGLRTARTSLTAEQAAALLRHGAGDGHNTGRSHEQNYLRDTFLLALLTVLGPRVSEVCDANIDDMSVESGQAVWRITGKGGKVRKVPLSPWLVERRDAYLQARPKPSPSLSPSQVADASRALVLTGRGGRITARDVQRFLERAQKRVHAADPDQAREVTPHALRHTAATILLSAGWDVKVVAQMLGHASIATTGIYLDELPGELARAVESHPLAQQPTP